MNSLTHGIISPERKRKIAHTTAHFSIRQVLFYPPDRVDKVNTVVIVFFNAGGNGKYIRVKNYVLRWKIGFFGQQFVCTTANFLFPFKTVSLPFFIKCHHNRSSTILSYFTGFGQKILFTFFQTDGIDNTFSLYTFQSRFYYFPF